MTIKTALADLAALQASGSGYLSDGFEVSLSDASDTVMLETYSPDPEFLAAFEVFAQADAGGSSYAIWRRETISDDEAYPVVVFGGEGGVHVVSENMRDFFRLLSVDVEPMVDWDGVDYTKEDDFAPSERHGEYLSWLAAQGLDPIERASELVAAAQSHHGEALAAFMARFQP